MADGDYSDRRARVANAQPDDVLAFSGSGWSQVMMTLANSGAPEVRAAVNEIENLETKNLNKDQLFK